MFYMMDFILTKNGMRIVINNLKKTRRNESLVKLQLRHNLTLTYICQVRSMKNHIAIIIYRNAILQENPNLD